MKTLLALTIALFLSACASPQAQRSTKPEDPDDGVMHVDPATGKIDPICAPGVTVRCRKEYRAGREVNGNWQAPIPIGAPPEYYGHPTPTAQGRLPIDVSGHSRDCPAGMEPCDEWKAKQKAYSDKIFGR